MKRTSKNKYNFESIPYEDSQNVTIVTNLSENSVSICYAVRFTQNQRRSPRLRFFCM